MIATRGAFNVAYAPQTRGGDLQVISLDVAHDPGPRGLVTRLALVRTDSLFFCREPGRGTLHPPFLGWLRSCEGGGVLTFGGDLGEVTHDGDTGRTALRPLMLRIGLNPLANGYDASYDRLRLLAWIGGGFDNVWTQADGGELSPRTQAGLRFLLRSADLRWELDLRGLGTLDPGEVDRDRGVEAGLGLAHHVLLGGGSADDDGEDAPSALHRTVPWAIVRIALDGSYARFDEPKNALPSVAGLFVSDRDEDTFQLLLRLGITPSALTFQQQTGSVPGPTPSHPVGFAREFAGTREQRAVGWARGARDAPGVLLESDWRLRQRRRARVYR